MTTIREQIILADQTIVESVPSIKVTKRSLMNFEDLSNFAQTQIPVAAVVGRLPKAKQYHKSSREIAVIGQIQSNLIVDIFVYFQCTTVELMDSELSEFANDMYTALFTDPTRDNLCIETLVDIEPDYAYWDPFVAFKVKVSHVYVHTTGGI